MPSTRRSSLQPQNDLDNEITKLEDAGAGSPAQRNRAISVARRLDAVQRLSSLQQEAYTSDDEPGYASETLEAYLDEAAEILKTLGPEYDEAITLKMVRGLADIHVKQTVCMMMYNKEWSFAEVKKILRASVREDVFDPGEEDTKTPAGRLLTN
ncbi:hypothetical protein TWF481_004968 [Arthrobotrys musiformis]|uniref:Uncharacterized protein n=1 Tax=Arthrobotrys musiformis TaxID=47236 RepID=A0AAV9WL39_9PEZI